MSASAGSILTAEILKRHGARADLRLWRNETAGAWAGKSVKVDAQGYRMLAPGSSFIYAGLCKGSADLIGVGLGGRFIAIEIKAKGDRVSDIQTRFLQTVRDLGGIAFIAESVADVDRELGPPPKR